MSLYPQITQESLLIDAATGVTVSDIVQDPADGSWVRRLLIFTDPPGNTNRVPVLEITLRGAQVSSVQIKTPQLTF